jgi:predicted aspartyl protease
MESSGTVAGAGLSGAFHTWLDGNDERDDQNLGPRAESVLRLGDDTVYLNTNGSVRRFTGINLRRARTEHFIDSGAFAKAPERVQVRGVATLAGRRAYVLEVNAEGGEPQMLFLDAQTWLPLEIAYDDDDGRTTIDLSDWRTVGGHRFPFRSVLSDGDHPFDLVQTTAEVKLPVAIDAALFVPPKSRTIAMSAAQTVPLESRGGHLYAPVRIADKTYQFLVDTGSQDIVLDSRIVHDAGLSAVGSLEASGATRTGGLKLVSLPEIFVGDGSLRDLAVASLDLSSATGGAFRIDGILGYPFFAAATVRIDPVGLSMTFGPPGSVATDGRRVPIETDRAFPEAHARLNAGVDGLFIVDTGNSQPMLLYAPFFKKHSALVDASTTSRSSYGIGGAAASMVTTIDSVEFGGVSLYHVDTDVMQTSNGAFADRFDAGNIGLGLLHNFIVTFDESRDALYLQKSAAFDDGRHTQ